MQVEFKPLGSEHLEWARLLHNDPEVLEMLTDPHNVSSEEQLGWFENLQKSKSSERWVAWSENIPIGLVRLDQIDNYNLSVCVGLDIHKDFRGQGRAKPIYRALFQEWFGNRHFNRVWLMVAGYNNRALNLYRGLGFKDEGVQKQALLKIGKFHDYVMMSILREDYYANPAL